MKDPMDRKEQKAYTIDFTHYKKEVEHLSYHLGDEFFESIEGSQILGGDVELALTITPLPDHLYDLAFAYDGVVTLPCDRCLAPLEYEMGVDEQMSVKLGEGLDDENDEFITLDAQEPKYDFTWIFYELLALHLPIQHVHEDPKDCDQDMLKYLVDTIPEEQKEQTEGTLAEGNDELFRKLREAVKDTKKENKQ